MTDEAQKSYNSILLTVITGLLTFGSFFYTRWMNTIEDNVAKLNTKIDLVQSQVTILASDFNIVKYRMDNNACCPRSK